MLESPEFGMSGSPMEGLPTVDGLGEVIGMSGALNFGPSGLTGGAGSKLVVCSMGSCEVIGVSSKNRLLSFGDESDGVARLSVAEGDAGSFGAAGVSVVIGACSATEVSPPSRTMVAMAIATKTTVAIALPIISINFLRCCVEGLDHCCPGKSGWS